jgi:hypothetical protein
MIRMKGTCFAPKLAISKSSRYRQLANKEVGANMMLEK